MTAWFLTSFLPAVGIILLAVTAVLACVGAAVALFYITSRF